MLGLDVGGILLQRLRAHSLGGIAKQCAFLLIVYYFVYANLIYLLARCGHLFRKREHVPAGRSELEAVYDREQPPLLTVLVPSYKEERGVVLQTLLSAGLMEYPSHRVVLLIDDPPNLADDEPAPQLAMMRGLAREVDRMLEVPRRRFASALAAFQLRASSGGVDFSAEAQRLEELYREAHDWFRRLALSFEIHDHTDKMFVDRILLSPAQEHLAHSHNVASAVRLNASVSELLREYRRVASLFGARFSAFERKQYVNLSHAPNKAMNLNSYISLLGKSFRVERRNDGLHLELCEAQEADLSVPDCDYLISLDADSLVLNDYAIRLVHFMEQPDNRKVAVAQTPYSAVPGSRILSSGLLAPPPTFSTSFTRDSPGLGRLTGSAQTHCCAAVRSMI
jgi:cellulose synthase/poly-beta-1,6-N-acetylglucosamine synthase-like glycosyltransferase